MLWRALASLYALVFCLILAHSWAQIPQTGAGLRAAGGIPCSSGSNVQVDQLGTIGVSSAIVTSYTYTGQASITSGMTKSALAGQDWNAAGQDVSN
jgi:hypothetical protein